MSTTDYGYRGMMVEYWDLLRGDTSKWSSRPYFLRLIKDSGEPAECVKYFETDFVMNLV